MYQKCICFVGIISADSPTSVTLSVNHTPLSVGIIPASSFDEKQSRYERRHTPVMSAL